MKRHRVHVPDPIHFERDDCDPNGDNAFNPVDSACNNRATYIGKLEGQNGKDIVSNAVSWLGLRFFTGKRCPKTGWGWRASALLRSGTYMSGQRSIQD